MLKPNAMVTYKDLSLKLDGHCGIVADRVPDKPDLVWVLWMGDTTHKSENIWDLEEI